MLPVQAAAKRWHAPLAEGTPPDAASAGQHHHQQEPVTPRPVTSQYHGPQPGPTGGPAGPSPRRGRQGRGDGQWALGYREPLNTNEELKKDDDGLNVRDRIENIYAKRGFDSIDPADLRGRMRWWGLYTQRRPGIDGGKTATLEPEELDDKYFMLRVRIDGGAADAPSSCASSPTSRAAYARDTADVTDRQNIQLHWIRIEDVPAIWEALESVGLSTTEACGDTPRVDPGLPGGRASTPTRSSTRTPAIAEIGGRFVGDPEFSNLPRKFKTAISGCPVQCTVHEINDISFVGVARPGRRARLRPVGRRRAVHQPDARPSGWACSSAPDQVPEVWAGVTSIFRDYGYRRLRHRARLKFLDRRLGPGAVPRGAGEGVSRLRAARRARAAGPAQRAARPRRRAPAAGRPLLRRLRAPGRADVRRDSLAPVADLAAGTAAAGSGPPPSRRWSSSTSPRPRSAELAAELDRADLPVAPSAFRRHTMACTGIEFCKLAIVETKAPGGRPDRRARAPAARLHEPITINVNGCPNSCARIQIADIGLKGTL